MKIAKNIPPRGLAKNATISTVDTIVGMRASKSDLPPPPPDGGRLYICRDVEIVFRLFILFGELLIVVGSIVLLTLTESYASCVCFGILADWLGDINP